MVRSLRIAPGHSLRARCAASVAICFAVELSQLYNAPGLDMLRRTTVGKLTIGTGFDLRDLLSYTTSILADRVPGTDRATVA